MALSAALDENPRTAREAGWEITYADTQGAALLVEGARVTVGPVDLISDINWRVMPGERWVIVGKNGAGKTTLLSALIGSNKNVRVSAGSIKVQRGLQVGYLEQTAVSGATRTVKEEVQSRMLDLIAAQARLAEVEAAMVEGATDTATLDEYADAMAAFEAAGGPTAEKRVTNVLTGLGFSQEDQERPCDQFSGGWQMRIALARLLLSEPDLLLLDEPTNHLDAAAREWVGSFLAAYQKTVVVVSHDENLLLTAADSVAEVARNSVETYKGMGYAKFLIERDERAQRRIALYESQLMEAEKLQAFIDKFGASATKATQAKDREKKLERLKKEMGPPPPGWGSSTAESKSNAIWGRGPVLSLADPPPAGMFPVQLAGAAIAPSAESPALLKGVDLVIERGMRLVIRGPNGAGKSTLVRALAGINPLLAGELKNDKQLSLGYFSQDLAQDLDQERVAIDLLMEEVREHDPLLTDTVGRSVLGGLGLTGDKATRQIKDLSGGEKARVALAIFCLIPRNVLVLDEPSNHLDMGALDALESAVVGFGGAVVVVSHDRKFCEGLNCTHVAYVRDGAVSVEERALTADDWALESAARYSAAPEDDAAEAADAVLDPEEEKRLKEARRQLGKVPGQIKKLEQKIGDAEDALALLEEQMLQHGSDLDKLSELNNKAEDLRQKTSKWYTDWEQLEAQLAEFPDLDL